MNLQSISAKMKPYRRYWPILLAGFVLVLLGLQIFQMDKLVRSKFEGKRWRLPSSVYARPLELYEGALVRQADFEKELRELSYAKVSKVDGVGEYSVQGDAVTVFRKSFIFFEGPEDPLKFTVHFSKGQVASIDVPEQPEASLVRLDPLKIGGIYPSQREDRKLVQLKSVPKNLIDALIAIEDRDFYDHWGVSIKGISRAMVNNIRAGRLVQGGSTLTQQLVKNFYLSSERSLKRKAVEAIYSVLLELHYSKEEILETYANEIYLGQSGDNAIHGFGLASEFYFGRPLERLNLEQSALLAALVNGPSHFNPVRFADRAKKRRDHVLDLLLEQQKISKIEFAAAKRTPVKVRPTRAWKLNRFPAYLDLVRRNLHRDYEEEDLAGEGLRVFTGFDPVVQLDTENASQAFLKTQGGKEGAALQLAAVVVSESGEVQALLGDRNPIYQGFNRALDAKRSIGSLAKPVVLLSALRDQKYSLASLVSDDPIRIPQTNGTVWEPQNFDHLSHGQVTLLKMLTASYNQATVRLGQQVGLKRIRDTFRKLSGLATVPNSQSLMLGSIDMSPFNVATMYYTIFSGGYRSDLRAVRGVQTSEGKPLKSYASKIHKEFDADVIHVLKYALRAVVFEGTARAAFNDLPMDIHAGGKTGTSNDQRDSWFAGFTGDKLAVAWVGNDQNMSTNLTGSSGALAVWSKIMGRVAHKSLELKAPENVSYQWVDASTGQLSFAECYGVKYLPFLKKTVPPRVTDGCPVVEESSPSAAAGGSSTFDWFLEGVH